MAEYIEREKLIEHLKKDPLFDLVERYGITGVIESIPAANVVPASDFRDCRNELCLKCGTYTQKHLGACDGCRWR